MTDPPAAAVFLGEMTALQNRYDAVRVVAADLAEIATVCDSLADGAGSDVGRAGKQAAAIAYRSAARRLTAALGDGALGDGPLG